MSTQMTNPLESLQVLAQGDFSTLDALKSLIADTYEASGLDPQTFMLVRMAALATLDAAPASWMMNISVSGEAGLAPEQILGTLIAIAPVIGTARIVSAASHITRAFYLAGELAGAAEAKQAEVGT
jgi:4-carboxymuconolactone decarboxylase